jgi:zinc protease
VSGTDIHCEVLPNGLTVLLREARLAPVAELQIWAKVGAADEREHERGLAHFHEHMLFKGTERRGVGEVAAEVEGAGGRINAYTSYDVTVYHATMPSARADVGLDVLSDAVLHSAFEPEEIRREIDVVLEEIQRSDDSPGSVLGNTVFAEAYRAHPYRFPILGSKESVSSIDRERLRGFYQRWYTPENLVVVAAGDIDKADMLARVHEIFGSLPAGSARRGRGNEPAQTQLRSRVLPCPFERANAELALPSVALAHRDTPYLDLVAYLLGGCDSSRLVRKVKESEGLADRIDAWSYTPLDPGVFAIDIETETPRLADAVAAAVREMTRLSNEPVSDEELHKARVNFLAMEHFERESVSGMASKLGSFHVTGGDYRMDAQYLDTVRNATPADLQRVAREYLTPERLTVCAVLPEAEAPDCDAAVLTGAVMRGAEHTQRAFTSPSPVSRAGIVEYDLDCGAKLHVLPRREVPVVAVRGAFLGGLLAETLETSGLTAFLTSMWLRGTRDHSAAGFAAAVEKRAAEIDSFSGRSSFGLTLEVPSAELMPSLDLFSQVLLEPAFDPSEFERERQDTLAAIERRQDRLGQLAFLAFGEEHFRSHPYRMPTLGSAEAVAAFDIDSVAAHHARLAVGDNLVIAVAGDVDPDEIALALSTRLADLQSGPFEMPSPPLEDAPSEIRRTELFKDRSQAHLVIGFRGITVADEDRYALDVLCQLLAGQGGRLFLELRDKQGLAYSVSAMSVEGLAPGFFTVYIATSPDRLEEARSGMLEELKRLLDGPANAQEIGRAREHLAGTFAIDRQRNSAHAGLMALNSRYGLGADAASQYPGRVMEVTAEDVLRLARRIIKLDAYTEAVVRPKG